MGLRSTYPGEDVLQLALRAVKDDGEKQRRGKAVERRELYLDNPLRILERHVDDIFRSPEVRLRIKPFLPLAATQNLFKRVIDEVSRPAYSPPPTRKVRGSKEDEANFAIVAAMARLNEKMDLACRLANACNTVHLFPRYVQRLQLPVIDLITPDQRTVIPDPDDPTRELALIYDQLVRRNGQWQTVYVCWDDEETFRFDEKGDAVPWTGTEWRRDHRLGILPFVAVHRRERWGTYEDETSGEDLAAGAKSAMLLHALVLKLHRDQGEKQIIVTGDDVAAMPKGQVIDGGGAVIAPGGTSISTLDLATDATHYLQTMDAITRTVAANHGISVERINASARTEAHDVGLLERRAELIKIFDAAEHELFERLKRVGSEAGYPISADAFLEIDYAEVSAQGDRLKQLDIWDREIRMGLRSPLDCVRESNPEIETEAEAKAEIHKNADDWAELIGLLKQLNIRSDADVTAPGQTPEQNGATGPAVRDGKMTRDEAAVRAKADSIEPLKSVVERALRG
jgi:hypothetical protein